jgi:hypothetical protein
MAPQAPVGLGGHLGQVVAMLHRNAGASVVAGTPDVATVDQLVTGRVQLGHEDIHTAVGGSVGPSVEEALPVT